MALGYGAVAVASQLARYGRKVVVLDKAVFLSDTLSTHVLFPTGVDELKRVGALDRILALNPCALSANRLHALASLRSPLADLKRPAQPTTPTNVATISSAAPRPRGPDAGAADRCRFGLVCWLDF